MFVGRWIGRLSLTRPFGLLLLGLIAPFQIFALDPSLPTSQYVLDHWGWARGLPEETISAIAQTPDGFLWIAHADGLIRFNGSTAAPSPWASTGSLDRSIRAITLASDGTLWGITVTGTIIRVPAGATHPPDGTPVETVFVADAKLRTANWRTALTALPGGIRFSDPRGIADLLPTAARSPISRLPLIDRLAAVAIDAKGAVWSASPNGKLERQVPGQPAQVLAELPAIRYDRLQLGRDGRVWLRGREMLVRWHKGKLDRWLLPEGFSNSSAHEPILEDRTGSVWLGGRGRILRFREGRMDSLLFNANLSEAPVTALFEDREGALWAGTLPGDLLRFRDSPVSSFGRAEGIAGDFINSILVDPQGDLVTHSMNRGLTFWRGNQRQPVPFKLGNLWYLARDPVSGTLVFGNGSTRYRLAGQNPELIPDPEAASIGPATGWWTDAVAGHVYVSRSSGLYRQASLLSNEGARRISKRGGWETFTVGPDGLLWGADPQRLFQISPQGERAPVPPDRLPDELIYSLFWDEPTQRLWIGTNRGLLTWDPAAGAWGARGLETDFVFSVQRDAHGSLWAATRRGLVRLEPTRWIAGMPAPDLRLTHSDGLRSLNFGMTRGQGAALLPNGNLAFASLQGVVSLNSDRIPVPHYGPSALLTELQANDSIVPLTSAMRLRPGTSRIKISFDAFSVSTPREVAVEYRLEGVDANWLPAAHRRTVQYNNLGPGQYRFRLRSRWLDGTGVREADLAWEIQPYFHQTLWFRVPASFLLLGLIALLIRRRLREQSQRTAELEARVAERTCELETAKASAEANARVKSEFLATMSHELRTPMNGVLGIAELLADTELNGVQRELLGTLRSSGESLLAVVDDVLDLSKIESGRLQLERIPMNLPQVMAGLGDLLRPMAVKKGIALGISSEGPEQPWIEGDPARLRQILLNLLGNAMKFTPSGQVNLKARWTENHVTLSVEDTGIGIPADKLPLLFQNFAQVDSSTTRLYGGTGLGLAICRRLVEAMHGSIECNSQIGSGSTFTVTLPITPAEPPTVAPPIATDRPAPLGLRVLVAEDNPTNQRIIVGLLNKIGIKGIRVVPNGLEAVEACRRETFDLVFMDCQMPILDGYGATRQINQYLGELAPPIVALTAHALESDREECEAAGMRAYLTKPVILEQLRQTIGDCCGTPVG